MLSADVPEFIPRAYRTLNSTNTENVKPKENITPPQQTKPPNITYKYPSHVRPDPSHIKTHSVREENEQPLSWRQPRKEFNDPREIPKYKTRRHEEEKEPPLSWRQHRNEFDDSREIERFKTKRQSTAKPLQRYDSTTQQKTTVKQNPNKNTNGKQKTSNENLELLMKNKFVAPRSSFTYTKVLKSKQPMERKLEEGPTKQEDFSFNTESNWPLLGASLPPNNAMERKTEPAVVERFNNPWVNRKNEGSQMKSPVESPRVIERNKITADVSTKPKTTTTSPSKNTKSEENPSPEKNILKVADASTKPKTKDPTSPIKHSKGAQNPRVERDAEYHASPSVRPKSTNFSLHNKRSPKLSPDSQPSLNTMQKIESDPVILRTTDERLKNPENFTTSTTHTPQRSSEINSGSRDNVWVRNKSVPMNKNKSTKQDEEPGKRENHARTDVQVQRRNSHEAKTHKEVIINDGEAKKEDDADLFEWKVMGERKKKVKIKTQEEVKSSPQLQTLTKGDTDAYSRVSPEKSNSSSKRNQEYTTKMTKREVLKFPKSKKEYLSSTQTQDASRKENLPSQEERNKQLTDKVMKHPHRSNEKQDTKKPSPQKSAATEDHNCVDEELLQKKLALKLKRKEEKRKLKEVKAQEALRLSRAKDTKVSLITTNFLEKTQALKKPYTPPSNTDRVPFTLEEYPTLGMQRNLTPNWPSIKSVPQPSSSVLQLDKNEPKTTSNLLSHTDLHQKSPPSLPSNKNLPKASPPGPSSHTDIRQDSSTALSPGRADHKASLSLTTTTKPPWPSNHETSPKNKNQTRERSQADELMNNLVPPKASSQGDTDAFDEYPSLTYKTALLTAKEKEMKLQNRHIKLKEEFPVDTTPEKKKVKTHDPIQLDLFALVKRTEKKKKKGSTTEKHEFSSSKRRHLEVRDNHRKTVGGAQAKGAVVLAKRGRINPDKPRKKKVSRIKKCKMEMIRKEAMALLLVKQAKAREQQAHLEASLSTCSDAVDSTKAITHAMTDTKEPIDVTTTIQTSKKEETPDKEDQEEQISTQETDRKIIGGDENKSCVTLHASSVDPKVMKTEDKPSDDEVKFKWKVNDLSPVAKDETPLSKEDANSTIKDVEKDRGDQTSSEDVRQSESNSSDHTDQKNLFTDCEEMEWMMDYVKTKHKGQNGPREYCHQVISEEVNEVAKNLIQTITTFQKRQFLRDPRKARMRKRFVCGLKETTKLMGKLSCVIMAPNIQQCTGPGSLDDAVEKLLNQAEKCKVPVVFALSTKKMKQLLFTKSKIVSCYGIINYHGAQELFKRLMELLPAAQKQYQELVAKGQCTVPKEGEEEEEEEEQQQAVSESAKDLKVEILAHTTSLLIAP